MQTLVFKVMNLEESVDCMCFILMYVTRYYCNPPAFLTKDFELFDQGYR